MVNYEDTFTSALNLRFMKNTHSTFTEPNLIQAYVIDGLIVSLILCFNKDPWKCHSAIFYAP